ncbi:hypothetical protein FJ420_17090 [Mesorhizobium sp. B3-1-3]|uniref:hypothetical protein n=1 Tax=unclassified Mesorhizobium TaxID=325217 RepID=UPI00112E11F3|nr:MULTISPECIES: hypothetical protein [unclassified Mesorhizobium]TPI64272.1 hypothetical protein FJ424_18070 [Mesorhizobium sp. B3-1-8]TPI70248.1 hypothetical protein FJ420_17090 [Mesorhizobium sp. B3-1-3]
MKNCYVAALCAAVSLAGCATPPEKIQASYVSPILYENLTCEQLALEATNISRRATEAAGVQNKKAGQDAAVVAVGVIVFWPALFFANGDGASAAEVARLKGEMQAIEDASTVKKCGIVFQKPTPPTPKKNNYP